MSNITRRDSLVLLGSLPAAAAAAATPERQQWIRGISSREAIRDRYFPNVKLVTQFGRTVRFYDDLIKDKIVVINFMYAECNGICPGVTTNLAKVQAALGDRVGRDIFMYSITLKPRQDTPAALKAFAAMHGVKRGWLFLTGEPSDVERLRRSLGFVDPDPALDRDLDSHIGNLRYGNEPLQLWAACPGLANPEAILESIGYVDWPRHARSGTAG